MSDGFVVSGNSHEKSSPYMRGRKIHTTSANTPKPFLCLTRSYGLRTLSIVRTFVCRNADISDSTLRIPEAPPERREAIEGISIPVLDAFHVSRDDGSCVGVLASVAAKRDGSVLRSGIEGCSTVR